MREVLISLMLLAGISSADTIPYLRTPDAAFTSLSGYTWQPHYVYVEPGHLRMHYLDEGSAKGPIVLLLHGNPSWSYLYRSMIPPLLAAGYRVIAPDLIGMGRSDKPLNRSDHTYNGHVVWITDFVKQLNLNDVTLFCQDWGGMIGLRVAAENGSRFARIVAANTGLVVANEMSSNPAVASWQQNSQTVAKWSKVIEGSTVVALSAGERAGYDAPYPSEEYKAAGRQMPLNIPMSSADPAVPGNIAAWNVLKQWHKPFLTLWGTEDKIFTLDFADSMKQNIPGAAGLAHATYTASHFIQEDVPAELSRKIIDLIGSTPVTGVIRTMQPSEFSAASHQRPVGVFDLLGRQAPDFEVGSAPLISNGSCIIYCEDGSTRLTIYGPVASTRGTR